MFGEPLMTAPASRCSETPSRLIVPVRKIPAGTQPDQLMRLSGKGMPKLNQNGARGDLFARIRVSLPRNLNAQQIELFKKLRDNG
jgi:DnaJ-class molecular chaperone